MSCWGKSSDATARRSPYGFSPKFASYVIWAYLSQSDEKTHWAPTDSKANRKPPIPQNKSINFGRFTLSRCTCEPKITQIGPNVSEALGYLLPRMLRKYSYLTCTFVILTILNSALTLELGPLLMSVREACPHLVPRRR